MPFPPDASKLALLFLAAANFIGIPGYALAVRLRSRRDKRDADVVTKAIVEYFRRSGVSVSVECIRSRNAGFTAVIESEPMKQFRLSHIIETLLREQVKKTCGLNLEKVYWRFPIRSASQDAKDSQGAAGSATKPVERADEYINEGLEHYRHLPKTEVEELPWEQFEQVTTIGREQQTAGPQAQAND